MFIHYPPQVTTGGRVLFLGALRVSLWVSFTSSQDQNVDISVVGEYACCASRCRFSSLPIRVD